MKNQKILIIGLPILLVIAAILSYIKLINNDNSAVKFKKEYESLNSKYFEVNIEDKNPVKYTSYNDILDVINNKVGVVFLGNPTDNNSRYAINTLLYAIKENSIDATVYYLEINNIDNNEKHIELYNLLNQYDDYEENYIPIMLFLKNGKIIRIKDISLDENYDDLKGIFEDYLLEIYSTSCDINASEPC